ncbi:MAG: hypothetical protein IJB70_08415 [Clostridia bacterium]|nr:hypothetical protein [Clostridia bacterium]
MINFLKKSIAWIILIVTIAALVPSLVQRISNEENNKNVTISVFYQNLRTITSDSKLDEMLSRYQKIGVNTVSLKEEDINYLVSKGDVTCIRYNVLCNKYDDESMLIAEEIAKRCPEITNDCHILMVKQKNMRERIAKSIPLYYTKNDCTTIKDVASMDIYVFSNGRRELWDIPLGYDEEAIDELSKRGFDICLMHKVNAFSSTGYLKKIDSLVKKYDNIKYINIQKAGDPFESKNAVKCVEGISEIINSNNLTLVVTENTNQLSNQPTLGYAQIFNSVMGEKGSKKVVRSYETYDNTQEDESHYLFRTNQYFNSTLDRNIRFVNVTQIQSSQGSYEDCAEYTFNAVKEYKTKIEAEGFSINANPPSFDYYPNRILIGALCAVIMIMCMLLMIEMVFGKKNFKLTLAAIVLAILAFLATFKMPAALFELYPTVYSVVMSCFALTVTLYFVKCFKDKLSTPTLTLGAIVTMVASLFAGSVGQGAMLSGIDFYMNNLIFRGIKLSLLVPVVYTAVAYYLMFIKDERSDVLGDIKKVLMADIKVYWVLIGGIIGIIGMYYIVRSGNVSEISSLESALRNTMTSLFPARPRTKEFLIGYPALVLFVYYTKNVDIKLIKWLLAIASSILAASVANSFCHVFTDYSVISMRVVNGLLVGIVISVFVYVANLIVVKLCKKLKTKFLS